MLSPVIVVYVLLSNELSTVSELSSACVFVYICVAHCAICILCAQRIVGPNSQKACYSIGTY